MTIKTMKRSGLCLAACMAAIGAATAMAEEVPVAESALAEATAAPTETVQFAQSRRFEELRRERRSDDPVPPGWQQVMADDDNSGRRWGANTDLSKRVAPGVWLIPGDGFVCIAHLNQRDGTLGFSCATPLEVEQGLLQPADLDATGAGVVTGVLPDGVDSVTLVNRDGTHRVVAVDRNVYRAAVDSSIAEVRWVDSLGVERVRSLAFTP